MRLLIISNRLPVTIEEENNELVIRESSGGLVSGISSYLESLRGSDPHSKSDYIWIGWPGIEIKNKDQESLKQKIYREYNAFPVYFSKDIMKKFYEGFCNNTIWPLFHYFPSLTTYDEEQWNCYKNVNEEFCKAVLEIIEPGDVIWIHDYHLMLLPQMIREKRNDVKIGFFLHIPFPTFEIFGLLPKKWRNDILKGLLGADVVGFHTFDYMQHFLRSVLRLLGYENNMGMIQHGNNITIADVFPMGIDFQKFRSASEDVEIKNDTQELKKVLNYKKIILSIDRLDYTKGIINRLRAFELFLEKNPEYCGKIILVLIVIPSRIGVKHYHSMKKQIDESVGRINGKFSQIDWSPISYQYDFSPFRQLVSIYSAADIIMVTPLRDGMNLISKEYLACRTDKTGVLILSEMAGSSKELGEAIIINPNHVEEISDAIFEAINMPLEEQHRRTEVMQKMLARYDVKKWANNFIRKLSCPSESGESLIRGRTLDMNKTEQIIAEFKQAENSIIFLDYDGTLVPFSKHPHNAKPDKELITLLKNLSKKTDLVIISGRDKNILHEWLGAVGSDIIAEHGAWIKKGAGEWQLLKSMSREWKKQIYSVFETYEDRLPGSFIEEKDFSLVFHYRRSDPELASIRIKEFVDFLLDFTSNSELQVLQGNKVVEVRNFGINKGIAGLNWLSGKKYDFILAIGDDWTDEDLFKVLPESAYTIKVGFANSFSKYSLPSYQNVLELLKKLSID